MVKNSNQRQIPLTKGQVKEIVQEHANYLDAELALNDALAARNSLTKQIKSAGANEKPSLIEQAANLKPKIHELESRTSDLEEKLIALASEIPNTTHPKTPIGNASKVKIMDYINSENQYTSEKALDHIEIGKELDLIDFESASKVCGTGFYFLKNGAVLLELALTQFALAKASEAGFMMTRCPDLIRSEFVSACGFKPRDNEGQQIYETQTTSGSLSLVGTAEIPLAALETSTTFQEDELPKRYVAWGRSFRAEAGARGQESRGLYRVHEFTKVELFSFCKPEQSEDEFTYITNLQKKIVKELDLCARVLEMPSEELSAPAHRKFDIEAWMPSRNDWGEITSTSNCTDYQARRLNIRYKPNDSSKKASEFVHTLNGTAVAVPRIIIAGLENWTLNGRVRIPECLRPYIGGAKEL